MVLTKKYLCDRLGIRHTSGRRAARLRALAFTDDVLAHLGMSLEEYKRRRDFTVVESHRIAELLHL